MPVTADQIREAIAGTGDLVRLLARADGAGPYRELGLRVEYKKEAATGLERIHARLQLFSSGGRI